MHWLGRAEIEKKVIRIQYALQKLGRDEVDAVGFNEIIPEIDSLCTKQSDHIDNTVKKKPQWAAEFDCKRLIRKFFVESRLNYICNLKKKLKKKRIYLINSV